MLRIPPQPAPTRVVTLEDLPQEPAAAPQPSVHIWGEGTPLGEVRRQPQALPAEREQEIHNMLAGRIAEGRELNIQELIELMSRDDLPEAIRTELQAWIRQFKELSQEQTEERLIAMGLLTILLESHLQEELPLDVKNMLLGMVDLCKQILQEMLPENESVESFIDQCENSLSRKKLLQEKKVLAQLVVRVQTKMLPLIAQMLDTRIEQACESLQKKMKAIQSTRRETHQTVRAEADALAQEVEQIRVRILAHVQRVAELGSEDAINNFDFSALLAECEATIGDV